MFIYVFKRTVPMLFRCAHAFLPHSCSVSLTSLPPSFSPLHSASGNAFKSSKPGKKGQHLHWLHTLFVLVNSQTFSPLLCASLSVVFLSPSLFSLDLQNRKTFSKSNCCFGGWPTPTERVLHQRDQICASSVFQSANWKKDTVAFHSLVLALYVGGICNLFDAAGGP